MIGDFKFYEVGGKIRDELLGLTNKDVDYVAVPTEAVYSKIHPCEAQLSPARLMFKALKNYLEEQKFEIFLVTPECYTIRAKFPEGYKYQGVADFVMARKEVGYVPGTRTPIVEPGNLYDDLSRRDFTINAMAKDPDTGEIIDYFGGPNGSPNAFCITITAHKSWLKFYQELMSSLDIPEHISERSDSNTLTIRICKREIIQLLQDVIVNNNLFHLKRKWSKLMIKKPSASES